MRTLVLALTIVALSASAAQAGPLCRVVGAALRGGKAAAKAPLVVVKDKPVRKALGRLLGR